MGARMRLRRADGRVYLDRRGWPKDGWFSAYVGAVFLHHMEAPDPGEDLHDHPWTFVSLVLWGGYTELRQETRLAQRDAFWVARNTAEANGSMWERGLRERRRWLSVRRMRLDECHRIVALSNRHCWTLVVHGPKRRTWGFYLPSGWMDYIDYDQTVRVDRRDLYVEGMDSDGEKII